jgi:uncharacterized repeat protein (TIGR01451 family)
MYQSIDTQPRSRLAVILVSGLLAIVMLLTMFQTIMAQSREPEPRPPDLGTSEKTVDDATAYPGQTLLYTILISNSGNQPATAVELTDTLPAELDYVPGSLSVAGSVGNYGVANGVITWTGVVNNNAQIEISFSAQLTATLVGGTVVTNTAQITGSGTLIEVSAATTVVTDTDSTVYLPIVYKAPPAAVLNLIGRPTPANEWTLSWSISDPTYVTGYEIQEDHTPAFTNPTVINVGQVTTYNRTRTPGFNNVYYYRLRPVGAWGVGDWSNTRAVVGAYEDQFSNPNSGWAIRRQDTDSVINDLFYSNGHLVMRTLSRWDYMLTAPMAPAPQGPYLIEARMRFVGVDNLHSYGFVFGGDWDGTPCPNNAYSSCFNQYYRLNVLWYGSPDRLRIQLKRIDYHDPVDNAGRGVDLIAFTDVAVIPPPADYQTWAVEVNPSGLIRVFVNGNLVGQATDATYIHRPYFGTFASVDEYTGLRAEVDWYRVLILP